MGTHVIHFNDDSGDLTDVEYFDSVYCLKDRLLTIDGTLGYVRMMDHGNTLGGGESESYGISWGAWPGGAETQGAVECATCGEHMWDGMADLDRRRLEEIR